MKKKTKRRLRLWSILIVVILILSFFSPILYDNILDYYHNYYACDGITLDRNKFKIYGIDISSHQDSINWQEVSRDNNIRFCFIKATEGKDFVDKRYLENYLGAKENNLFVGAYHFFRFSSSGKEQAKNFMNIVDIESLDFPPVVDVERHGNYLSFTNIADIRKELRAFLKEIEKNYFISPIIYTNIEGYEKYIKGYFEDYELWICRICSEPKIHHWTFWQYSHKGNVKGINGKVDMNTFNGDKNRFYNYIEEYKLQMI